MPEIANVKCCTRGYHLVEFPAVLEWLAADCTIYLAQGRGKTHTNDGRKTAYSQARLLRRLEFSEKDMRLFAADCAEHVLHLFEKKYPKDDRPRKAIEAVRKFAQGEISDEERDAATAAAGDAATAAAGDAAWAAAGAAAWDAAWAARAAEQQWQGDRLAFYLPT